MTKLIVTGATGFVGTNLVQFFKTDDAYEVIPIGLRTEVPKFLPSATAIIHLAGKAHDLKKTSNDDEYFEVNFSKTIKLFDVFLQSKIRDFFFFSSVKAVADNLQEPLKEDYIPNPQSPYGISKLKAEEYILSKKLPANKRVFIIRPCMIHGPGDKGNLSLLYQVVKRGIPYPLASFENRRSFLSIDNLNFLTKRMLQDAEVPSGVYNFADDEPVSTKDLFSIIAATIRKKQRYWHIPVKVIKFIATAGDILHLPLNTERLNKLTGTYVVSNYKIKMALSINQLPVAAEEGLEKTIKSFINR